MKPRKLYALFLALTMLFLSSCEVDLNQILEYLAESVELTEESASNEESSTEPRQPVYQAEGVILSKESNTLVLYAKWSAFSLDADTVTVTVKTGISCYGISTGKHQLFVSVNDESAEFTTPPIASTTEQKKRFDFQEFTFDVKFDDVKSQGLLDITVIWDYNGIYNGQQITTLIASEKISILNKETTETEESTTQEAPTEQPPESSEEISGSTSEEVTAPPKPTEYTAEGLAVSNEAELLVLYAKWNAISKDGKKATVTVQTGITCYSLTTGKHKLTVSVNGDTQFSVTNPIVNTLDEKKKFDFATFTFEIELDKELPDLLDISVAWEYNGSYGGQSFEKLTASALVTFPDTGADQPTEQAEVIPSALEISEQEPQQP